MDDSCIINQGVRPMVDKRHNVRCAVNPQTLKELQRYKREKQLANIGAAIDRLVRKSSETNEALQMEKQKK